jgi:hypothetical protein
MILKPNNYMFFDKYFLSVTMLFFFAVGTLTAQNTPAPTYEGKWKWEYSTVSTRGMAKQSLVTPADLGTELVMELKKNNIMYLYHNGELVFKGEYGINKSGDGTFIFVWDSDKFQVDPNPEVGPIEITEDEITINGAYNDGGLNQKFVKL